MVRSKVFFFSSFLPPSLLPFFTGFAEFAIIFLPPNFEFSLFGSALYIAIVAPNQREPVYRVLVLKIKPLTHKGQHAASARMLGC
jgi:hypothetical protein